MFFAMSCDFEIKLNKLNRTEFLSAVAIVVSFVLMSVKGLNSVQLCSTQLNGIMSPVVS